MVARRTSVISLGLMVIAAIFVIVAPASAAVNTLHIDPATESVTKGAAFTAKVISTATVPISGVQATLTFDRTKLQVTAVTRGTAWVDATSLQTGGSVAAAIANANSSGKLKTWASTFLDGSSSVPAGNADFLIVTFSAIGCGSVTLGLPVGPLDAVMLDGGARYGATIPVSTVAGKLTITGTNCAAATPPPSSGASAPAATAGPSAPAGSTVPSESPSGSADASMPAESASPTASADASPGSSEPASPTPTSPPIAPASSDNGPGLPIAVIAVIAVIAGIAGGSYFFYRRRGGGAGSVR